jgi:integrase
MSTRKRSSARQGIESRRAADGREQHRALVYDRLTARKLRGPWTNSLAEARSWRVDALARLQAGTLSGDRGLTVREAVDTFVAGIANGSIRDRSGRIYKPSTRRGYLRELRGRIVEAFGGSHLRELTLPDVQRWADGLAADGFAPATVRNVVTALRALYGWALPRGMATVNPTVGLRLPTGSTARDRIASPAEAARLIAVLRPSDQAALGLAVYAGLRLGELLALDWSAIDTDAHRIHVRRSWDHGARQYVAPKSKAGTRTVPIVDRLGLLLADHRVLSNQADGLLFAGRGGQPASHNALRDRMRRAWRVHGLAPLGLHEARHTYASLMIAAGVNAKALSTYMGHANIAITFDRYGHLMPGNEAEARSLADAYLARDLA